MKNIFESIIVTIAMFSKIPTPHIEWNKKNMKNVFVFFPFIGVVIGMIEYAWYLFYINHSLNSFFYAAIASAIPILITGGIHLDGYADSCDAFFSYGDREKRLEILSDPNVGAFGVIYLIVYILGTLGAWSQISEMSLPWQFFMIPYIVGRIIGGYFTKFVKPAKKTGLMMVFNNPGEKDSTAFFMIIWTICICILMYTVSVWYMVINLVGIAVFMIVYTIYVNKNFGGFTGDLIGFSTSVTEMISLFALVLWGVN